MARRPKLAAVPVVPTLHADHFQAMLTEARLTQAAFGTLYGVSRKQVNHWCQGKADVPGGAALVAAAILMVGVGELVGKVQRVELDADLAELKLLKLSGLALDQ